MPRGKCLADANPAPIEADNIADVELSSALALDFAVHIHEPVENCLFHVPTGVEKSGELEELPQANHFSTDRDMVYGRGICHIGNVSRRVPAPSPERLGTGWRGQPDRMYR